MILQDILLGIGVIIKSVFHLLFTGGILSWCSLGQDLESTH